MGAIGGGYGNVNGKSSGKVISNPVGGKPVLQPAPATFNRPSYSVISATSGLPMNEHVAQYGAPGATPSYLAAQSALNGGGSDGGGDSGGYTAPQVTFQNGSGGQSPIVDPNTDYLQEAGFIAQKSALEEAMKNFTSQNTTDLGNYDLDFDNGLRDLGFRDNTPNVTTDNLDDLKNGARNWDWNDVLSASGRGYQQNTNDFASRGMLSSQGYLDSLDNLTRSLESQRDSMATGRTTFRQGKTDEATNYGVQNTASLNTAKIDAIARLSNALGLS